MPRYNNIPSIYTELLDGNLKIDRQITGPVVLVIGTAYSGPSNAQYLVTDSNVATSVYGANSPLVKGLSRAKLGGAENVILYRIGGKAASLTIENGPVIETVAETSDSGTSYKVYFGPEPSDPTTFCTIVFNTAGKIVYSDVTGSEIDLAEVTVSTYSKATNVGLIIGTPSVPVTLATAITEANATERLEFTVTGDNTTDTYDIGADDIGGFNIVSIDVDGVDLALTVDYTLTGSDVTLVAGNLGMGEVLTVVFDNTEVDFGASAFSAGENNISSSLQKKYELLHEAYLDLETTIATHAILAVDGVILDALNLADNIALEMVDTDKLAYIRITESDGAYTYEWSDYKTIYQELGQTDFQKAPGGELEDDITATVGNADLDDNGQPIIAKQFNEVHFAHQFGTWLHTITENERFVLGAIGTSQPSSTSNSAVSQWIGTLPQTDINGNITVNGTGLLGNRWMAGATDQVNGFYLTDSGFPDGNTQADSVGSPIDLGKYMSVVAGSIVTPSYKAAGSTAGIENGAMIYGALVSTVDPGNSTTNIDVPRVTLPYIIKKTKLDELSSVGYVVFYNKPSGATAVLSGELPTGPNSDYDYISTSIIVSNVITRIRARVNPFLGKGINGVMVAAIDTAVEDIFKDEVKAGNVIKYLFNVIVEPTTDGRGKLRIPTTIVPAFELREVNVPIKLAYDI